MASKIFLISSCVLLALLFVQSAESLKCYSCGNLDSTCKDPFNTGGKNTVTCSGDQVCSKTRVTATTGTLVDGMVSRGCDKLSVGCAISGGVETCGCNTEMCNSATSKSGFFALLVLSVGAVLLF